MKKFVTACFLTALCSSGFGETSTRYIQRHAREFSGTQISPESLESITNKKLVLIGEIHGSAEMPAIAGQIVKSLSQKTPLLFGIEFPREYQSNVDEFMRTGDVEALRSTAFFKDPVYGSGRSSAAMVELLSSLRTLKNLKVFCFDLGPKPGRESRDTEMAKKIWTVMSANPGVKVVTYSGNIHSCLVQGLPGIPNYTVMGAELLRLSQGQLNFRNSTNVAFRVEQGTFWNCIQGEDGKPSCGIHDSSAVKTVYSEAVNYQRYFVHEPMIADGHFNSIFIRTVSASPPLQ